MCNGNIPPADANIKASKTAASVFKTISKTELATHNTPSSAWCAVHSENSAVDYTDGHVVLDITSFASKHPGGDLILLAAGKDASVLFETYHPRGVPPSLVKKLQIGIMEKGSYDSSFYSWHSDFYKVLKRRVVERLEERELSRRGSLEIWIKALFLLGGFWFSLIQMYTNTNFVVATMWSLTMGFFAAMIGINIQHDGNHGAFAQSKFVNKCAGWTMDMIGASAFTWEVQHMLGHHPYTNVLDGIEDTKKAEGVDCKIEDKDQESDPDVFSSFPLMRMHPSHTPSWINRYQHLYAPFLFAFMTLAKVFQQDFEVAISKRLYHIDAKVRYGCTWNVMRFWGMKIITMIYMMALPIYFHGAVKGVSLFVFGHLACGELLATVFIVNHVIEGVSYAKKDSKQGDDGKKVGRPETMMGDTPMEKTRKDAYENSSNEKDVPSVPFNDWAAVQCQTSVNWAPGSWFWNHFSGGLSHQIEHHLLPSICHTNYAYIQDVVEKTCDEYGVPYQSEPSLWVAYGKMINHLKYLGRGKNE
mmetsp:Transcript_7996/g.19715  ORF Transcript_7996/g.19715 Transcript_7996/m.19715 type:complete len:530 (+) Transcript_7996:90-1679(+)|eukprot:CAMPEP_0181126972 /NCGR_PEP_ID=MMETSP1071-20121207/27934_1 /TAXON_ID=35127 /ORGANISM="Thalassiosira sp., Strain NH16" /LENGTH=529 /DNA_ID=CAMNT_0023212649 /DNA_START=64 /DNA_END=1653 /DNA_ORIENTATION=-